MAEEIAKAEKRIERLIRIIETSVVKNVYVVKLSHQGVRVQEKQPVQLLCLTK